MGIRSWLSTGALALLCAGAARASEPITVELNRLQDLAPGCRMHLVIANPGDRRLDTFQLDLVLFGPDGVVVRRVALDASPLRAHKTSVYAFDVPDLACGGFGRVLLNDVAGCGAKGDPARDCVSAIAVSSRAGVELVK